MVYVLSSGPVCRYAGLYAFHGYRIFGIVDVIYKPVWEVYWNTPLHKPLGMYWHLWKPALFLANGKFALEE